MAIWKDPTPATKANEPSRFDLASPAPAPAATPEPMAPAPAAPAPIRAVDNGAAARESVIAADLTIEGKIEGSGHVRIAGKFKGDVNVQGNLRIESGAKLNGGVKAKQVVVAGELEGNIDSASKVELLDSAVLVGDVKTGTLIVNAGSKIRGHVECGWDDKSTKSGKASESDAAS